MDFSDYIVLADESADHGLVSIDPQFPVFALVFCAFEKTIYAETVEPAFRKLKFNWFGHDAAILHERELHKKMPPFDFLRASAATRDVFMAEVDAIMAEARFHAYVAVIDKIKLRGRYQQPHNPYDLAMLFCMEKLSNRLVVDGQRGRLTYVLFEARGRAEDTQLELEFRRVTANQRQWGWRRVDFYARAARAGFRAQGRQSGRASTDRSDRVRWSCARCAPISPTVRRNSFPTGSGT